MSKTPLGEHVPFYRCECGATFAGQDAMRAHTRQCEAMPHITDSE